MSVSILAGAILAAASMQATDAPAVTANPQQIQDTSAPQASPPAAPEPTPLAARLDDRSLSADPAQGVTRYDLSFFAAMRPISAKDLIARVPGFAFKDVDPSIRGFAGAGGNV